MLSIIIDTYNQMPEWSRLLIAWPLPASLVSLYLTLGYRKELASPFQSQCEGIVPMIWVFAIIWPIFVITVVLLTLFETIKWFQETIPRLWSNFGKWTKNKHAAPPKEVENIKHKINPQLKCKRNISI